MDPQQAWAPAQAPILAWAPAVEAPEAAGEALRRDWTRGGDRRRLATQTAISSLWETYPRTSTMTNSRHSSQVSTSCVIGFIFPDH